MTTSLRRVAALGAISLALIAGPAVAQVAITQSKATTGNITPGDAPGFPVTLTQPGSYILKGNLTPPAGADGIEIKSHDVTIDFNGFRLQGFLAASEGIFASGTQADSATIKNGVVAGFTGGTAIFGHAYWTIQDMKILVNRNIGITVGIDGRVQRNIIAFNGSFGVGCNAACLIEDNIISNNTGQGIAANTGSTILWNTIYSNGGLGIDDLGTFVGFGNNTY